MLASKNFKATKWHNAFIESRLSSISIFPSEISSDVTLLQQPTLTVQGWVGWLFYVLPLSPCALPYILLQLFVFVFVSLSKIFKGRDWVFLIVTTESMYKEGSNKHLLDEWMDGRTDFFFQFSWITCSIYSFIFC